MQRFVFGACAALLFSASTYAADPSAVTDAVVKLPWQIGAASYQIHSSSAVITTSSGDAYLEGPAAHQFMQLMEGHSRFTPDAVVLRIEGALADSFVTYGYLDTGHVAMTDWEEHINADEILSIMREKTTATNKVREAGYPELFIDGWMEKPSLNRETAVVYWAVRGHDDRGGEFVNAKALKLGRHGMTDLVWVGTPQQFEGAARNLQPALDAYAHREGFRYADFQPSVDKVAAVGIGAIAYQMLTGTSKQGAAIGAGIVAVAIAFAKKLWFLIFVPFAAGWAYLKRRVRRKQDGPPV